jgi:hypothetical protein
MAVEGANQAFEVVPVCLLTQLAICNRRPKVAPNIMPHAKVHPKCVKQLLHNHQRILRPSTPQTQAIERNSQLPAPDHICDHQHEAMATQSQKNTLLVGDTEHLRCHVVNHIFPPVSTRIVDPL